MSTCTQTEILRINIASVLKRLLFFSKIIYSSHTECDMTPHECGRAFQDFITFFNQKKVNTSTQSFVRLIRFLTNSMIIPKFTKTNLWQETSAVSEHKKALSKTKQPHLEKEDNVC